MYLCKGKRMQNKPHMKITGPITTLIFKKRAPVELTFEKPCMAPHIAFFSRVQKSQARTGLRKENWRDTAR